MVLLAAAFQKVDLCISFCLSSFFSPLMEALDDVMLTGRDKDHENHLGRQRRKGICPFELAGDPDTQRFCAVMIPPQFFKAAAVRAACICSFLFKDALSLLSVSRRQPKGHLTACACPPHLWIGAIDGTAESQDAKIDVLLMVQSPRTHKAMQKVSHWLAAEKNKEMEGTSMRSSTPLRWIHTSVIFTRAWTNTVNNTSARPSGVCTEG